MSEIGGISPGNEEAVFIGRVERLEIKTQKRDSSGFSSFFIWHLTSSGPTDRPQGGLAMLQLNSDSSSTSFPHMNLTRVYENGLYDDISPRLSNHFRSLCIDLFRENKGQSKTSEFNGTFTSHEIHPMIALMEGTPSNKSPLHYFLEASGCSSTTTTPSTDTLISKPAAEMIREISMLEVEIIHLERYLLSLYRTSFENHLATLSSTFMDQDSRPYSQCKTESSLQELIGHSSCREACDNVGMQRSGRVQQNPAASICSRTNNPISPPPPKGKYKRGSGLPRLADHLGGSLLDQIAETPDKLSEEIVRCMTAIYCNLASSRQPDIGASVSSSPSLSSSNTLSPQDLHDNWSPLCSEETTEYPCQPEGLKENNGPYAKMVEISKISLDDERLNYVASMLQNFRSLVRHLEKVDPRKMNREEKLTFWINIHNALVMHAYLAYGIHHNRIRSTSLILKAAYNVGGHSISAHVIQSSILGCRSHRSASWLPAFFMSGTKSTGGSRHTYALDYQEPLVYFSLCSGAYSDPAVRVYTSKNIFEALNIAKQEFIRARVVSICKEGTNKKLILLPRILHYFAKDASLNLYGLLEMVHVCQSEAQRKALEGCLKGGKPDKYIEWLPYNSAFRYVINP